jgi:transcriptional regulator of met regulon
MLRKKTITTVSVLTAIVLVTTAGTMRPASSFKNLKVLPKNISERQLDSIMDTYNRALKVNCDFCHAKAKDITGLAPANDGSLDFAAENGMKENARRMMRLTIDINKQHFNYDTIPKKPDYLLNVITCNTCHRGNAFPAHE